MEEINRRSVLAFGATAAVATPLIAFTTPAGAAAPTYGPNDGMDIGAGRRMIDVGV